MSPFPNYSLSFLFRKCSTSYFSRNAFPNYSKSLFYKRMLYELLKNDQGGPGSARQPLSATPAQARRRHPSFAAKRCCVSPAWVLGSPGLPWLLWLASAAPGMPQGGHGAPGSRPVQPQPGPGSATQASSETGVRQFGVALGASSACLAASGRA